MLASFGPLAQPPVHAARLGAGRTLGRRAGFGVLPMPPLEWNAEVERDTAHLYERIKTVVPSVEWPFFAPYVKAINDAEEGAQRRHPGAQLPDAGDLQLRRRFRRRLAASSRARRPRSRPTIIVQAGVHFMAETSKILNPDKTVLIPDRARRLLARLLDHRRGRAAAARAVSRACRSSTYVNTSADVKAESRHLLHVVERACRWSRASASTR